MRNGLLPYWLRARRATGGTLALTLTDGAVRYVFASQSDERGASIAAWGTVLRANQPRDAFLGRVADLLPMAGRVVVVLDVADYQMLQVEAPNVPTEELYSAMRWRAMEFMQGSPNDYTLDLLALNAEPGRVSNVIAAVAHNDVVRAKMIECQKMGQPCTVIDVTETCQRNLLHAVLLSESVEPPVAGALVVSGGRALLVISVQGQLYFFRRFEIDVDTLAVAVNDTQTSLIGSSAGEDSATLSLVQLHRSLDLWDLGYPNLPLATLRVDAGPKTPAVIDRLLPETGVDTRPLTLSPIFKLPSSKVPPPWQDPAYLPLLGAVLRSRETVV